MVKNITLDNFYQSKEWKNFRDILIQERTEKDTGLVICQYCGKPIFGKGQIVAHHLEELTEYNVCNPKISLNPDNVVLVHLNCHNVIHTKYINCKKEVYLLYGPPTSYFDFLENEVGPNDLIVCMDWIYKALNPQNILYPKTSGLFQPAINTRNFLIDYVRTSQAYGKWSRAFIAGGYPTPRDRTDICDKLGIPKENIIFFDMTKEEALDNMKKYNAPKSYEKYIHEWFEEYEGE